MAQSRVKICVDVSWCNFFNSNFLAPGSAKYFVIIKLPFALQAAVMVEASQALHSSDSVDSQAYQPSSAAQSIGKEQRWAVFKCGSISMTYIFPHFLWFFQLIKGTDNSFEISETRRTHARYTQNLQEDIVTVSDHSDWNTLDTLYNHVYQCIFANNDFCSLSSGKADGLLFYRMKNKKTRLKGKWSITCFLTRRTCRTKKYVGLLV